MWTTFWAIAHKETSHLSRNTRALKRILTAQCLTFLLLAFLDRTVRNMPTVIVDQDRTAESREIAARLTATHTFDIKYVTSSTEQARGHIRAGRAKIALVIPPDYSRQRAAGEDAQILALVDGSDSTSSAQATASIEGMAARFNEEARQEVLDAATATVQAHTEVLYNPQRRVASFMLPGALGIIMGLAYARLVAVSLANEREAGNLERLLMTPMNYKGLIAGKVAPWFFFAVFNGALYLTVMRFVFDVPIRGSIVLLLVSVTLYSLTVLCIGAMIGAGASRAGEAMQLLNWFTLPSIMLSGYIFPLSSLPKVLLPISYALPQMHFIEIMRGICLRGATATDLAPHLLYFIIAPFISLFLAARRFQATVMD